MHCCIFEGPICLNGPFREFDRRSIFKAQPNKSKEIGNLAFQGASRCIFVGPVVWASWRRHNTRTWHKASMLHPPPTRTQFAKLPILPLLSLWFSIPNPIRCKIFMVHCVRIFLLWDGKKGSRAPRCPFRLLWSKVLILAKRYLKSLCSEADVQLPFAELNISARKGRTKAWSSLVVPRPNRPTSGHEILLKSPRANWLSRFKVPSEILGVISRSFSLQVAWL